MNGPHYGASFLFTTYFLDRFGETATQTLIKDPANGFDGVENVLKQINAIDPATGQLISSDDLFMDWAVTNLTLDASIGDGRYIYKNYPCLLYTSDAADERSSVDLGGRRII